MLIPNWKQVAIHANSAIALIFLATLVAWGPDIAFLLMGRDPAPWTWTIIGFGIAAWGIGGRLIDQGLWLRTWERPWKRTLAKYVTLLAITGGLIAWGSRVHAMSEKVAVYPDLPSIQVPTEDQSVEFCTPFVAEWEGVRLRAYMPTPNDRPTIGFGATHIGGVPVQMGDVITMDQAIELLDQHLRYYRAGMHRYWTEETVQARLPITRDCAFISFPLNVGIAGAGGSTAAKRLNAGWIEGACEALGWWNRQGSRVLRGLVNRRAAETELCMVGL
jgi:GH24 family phage-related lysozyme (muramidase)